VDAWDGFEDGEKEGSAEVDHELSSKINLMNLSLACVEERPSKKTKEVSDTVGAFSWCGANKWWWGATYDGC
jgi:hypothetical protein